MEDSEPAAPSEEKMSTEAAEPREKVDEAENVVKAEESPVTTTAGETPDALLNAKKMKIEVKEKKEKKQKVDEDEIQKMQILVSSFSEEQLNRYEMYRRSAFPKAAIKRV
ncbi:hypothetical protein AB205_0107670 [Aquarana catesbeiana]|uniref:TAFII28-like protein domain-containing protein n=1 Tax=Aquarana catesbeiana TaxID=8400 RepID=A0A2G9RZ01_AQUCT|nr:hypothetical protein AB205_0107670 [Aquarana catesbeiana]